MAFAKTNGTVVGNKQGHGLVTGDIVYISAEKELKYSDGTSKFSQPVSKGAGTQTFLDKLYGR